ncbi:hypothetical protein WOLCODRAFT_76994 [Wolfiporia cocos MD-104 SS10]|uniref:Uncharacterized protein n=1 Tax=Wolfiporia cocos (strain MD-104) TaxID=742152 RepID=A0A2H3JQ92_WOLCO|nr:hypothetical protein WOLCODRAFT_76994 [Wolfiporia cocos MD-104 SS10]
MDLPVGLLDELSLDDDSGTQLGNNFNPSSEDLSIPDQITLKDLRDTVDMQHLLRNSRLEDEITDPGVLEHIRNPPTELVNIDDPVITLSIKVYLGLDYVAQEYYNLIRRAVARCPPHIEMLSFSEVKAKVAEITGIIALKHNVCISSCMAFTGIYSNLLICSYCGENRYVEKRVRRKHVNVPRKQMTTIPIGPVLQAMHRSVVSSEDANYHSKLTRNVLRSLLTNDSIIPGYTDFVHGEDYLNACNKGDIGDDDIVLMFSMDGAQLYACKQSDCWVYMWVLLDYAPEVRYKKTHVIPGGIIPGPNKPKNVDSFIFPGLHILSSHMIEGLKIWDLCGGIIDSKLFLLLATADSVGMTYLNGLVGHSGAQGCRIYCPLKGRHKPGSGYYYPACLKPDNYDVANCSHEDVKLQILDSVEASKQHYDNLTCVLGARTDREFQKLRLETGIAKPSLFGGLPLRSTLGLLACFPADIMHLVAINIPDLFISLWCGMIQCNPNDDRSTWRFMVLTKDTWEAHGKAVAATTPYLPGSFDRAPRNIANKLTSGYKAWEHLIHLYCLCPALLYNVLPEVFYRNLCKLVRGVCLLYQRNISHADIMEASVLFIMFEKDYELIYYERKTARLHFMWQSIHSVTHIPTETERLGPETIFSQWPMERLLRELGLQIRNHSSAYANMAEIAVRRCRTNAIHAMIPALTEPQLLLCGAIDLGGGYALLRRSEDKATPITDAEKCVIVPYLESMGVAMSAYWTSNPTISRWACIILPNKQVARSLWREADTPVKKL